ncbi:MAG TPA: TIGR03857 family LLM class F420-dependent oxidoreductase [Pseudonocardia sp.]
MTTNVSGALAPVAADMSAWIIAGAVASRQDGPEFDTVARTPAQGIDDGATAERLGFRRVWLSERIDIKWSDVILSGVGARTSRLDIGTGVVDPTTRHPWTMAAFAATMQACYGDRFILGLGRGENAYFKGTGIRQASYRYMADYIDILRKLWAGDRVDYEGPVGSFQGMSFAETYHGDAPPVWFAGFAHPKGAELIARSCDGVLLIPMMTPDAVHDAVGRIRSACQQIGRDPSEIRTCVAVVTAPDMDDFEARAIAHGRAVTYLQYPGYGEAMCDANGWDHQVLSDIRNHPKLAGLRDVADRTFQRHQMMDVAAAVPDEHMLDCCAIGTVDECVTSLRRFLDAGADEVATYGSTPQQNASLVAAWRDRKPG